MQTFLILTLCVLTMSCATKDKSEMQMSFKEVERRYSDQAALAFYSLTYVAEKAPDCESIQKYSNKLLQASADYRDDWNFGNAIFVANASLGYCAITKGDIKAAEEYLAKAGSAPGSPQLNTAGLFGFEMRLPRALLQKGRKDSVLKFLDASKRFWEKQFSEEPIAKWKSKINAGEIPEFRRSEF